MKKFLRAVVKPSLFTTVVVLIIISTYINAHAATVTTINLDGKDWTIEMVTGDVDVLFDRLSAQPWYDNSTRSDTAWRFMEALDYKLSYKVHSTDHEDYYRTPDFFWLEGHISDPYPHMSSFKGFEIVPKGTIPNPSQVGIQQQGATTYNIALNSASGTYAVVQSPVPVPSTVFLLGAGLLGLAGVNRKKSRFK